MKKIFLIVGLMMVVIGSQAQSLDTSKFKGILVTNADQPVITMDGKTNGGYFKFNWGGTNLYSWILNNNNTLILQDSGGDPIVTFGQDNASAFAGAVTASSVTSTGLGKFASVLLTNNAANISFTIDLPTNNIFELFSFNRNSTNRFDMGYEGAADLFVINNAASDNVFAIDQDGNLSIFGRVTSTGFTQTGTAGNGYAFYTSGVMNPVSGGTAFQFAGYDSISGPNNRGIVGGNGISIANDDDNTTINVNGTNIANFVFDNSTVTLGTPKTNIAQRATWELTVKFTDAVGGAPGLLIKRSHIGGTNTIMPVALGLTTSTTNFYSFKVNPLDVYSATDASGTGASVTIVSSSLVLE